MSYPARAEGLVNMYIHPHYAFNHTPIVIHSNPHTYACIHIISIHIYHHHHHVLLLARISLTLSRHFSLSFIASGRSSGLHPVSSHSCCMYVRADRPAFPRLYVGVHRSTSLMSSSLLLQQCPACPVCLTCIVFVSGSDGPYMHIKILTTTITCIITQEHMHLGPEELIMSLI